MKKIGLPLFLISMYQSFVCQNVSINTTGLAPNVSAMLDVESTTKGLLIPRIALLSNTDATTIITPATSLLIYNTTTAGLAPNNIEPGYYYNSGTTAAPVWQRLLSSVNTTSNAWLINGNSGTVNGTNFIGTTDNVPLDFKVNNEVAGKIDPIYGNTLFGHLCGLNNTGNENTAIGKYSLFSNTTGGANTIIGYSAGGNNVTGDFLTAVGYHALSSNTSGVNNLATGKYALLNNTTGSSNTAIGTNALFDNSTGHSNTAVGTNALLNNTTGFRNIGIGLGCNVSIANLFNATTIGYNSSVNANNKIRLGNAAITVIEGQVAYTFPSDARFKENVKEDVPGLNFILNLRPVSYNFNRLLFAQHIKEDTDGRETELTELSKNRSSGFLAQDVEKLIKTLGFESFDAIHKPTNETDNYSLSYSHFVIPLVKAVQEQQGIITKQATLINSLIKRIELLEKINFNKE